MTLKWFHTVGIVLVGGVIFFVCYPRIENFFVFFPQKELDLLPAALRLEAEDVYLESGSDALIHGWFFPPPDDHSPVLLFCHGNAGNISHRLDNVMYLVRHGLGVMLFDYRGYGKSTGRPSEKGIYADGLAMHDHLVNDRGISPERIVPFGRSLGAAVALEVALHRPVRCVIIESAFTSTKAMARQMGPFALLSPVLPPNYNNHDKITRLKVPVMIIHGRDDDIVPFSMGELLYAAAPEPKAFLPLDGAGHNDTYFVGGEPYFKALAGFVGKAGDKVLR